MGGNMFGVENCVQYTGEFNFYGDLESAKIVLDKYPQQVKSKIVRNLYFTREFEKNIDFWNENFKYHSLGSKIR